VNVTGPLFETTMVLPPSPCAMVPLSFAAAIPRAV
jgi:hypothetical protein